VQSIDSKSLFRTIGDSKNQIETPLSLAKRLHDFQFLTSAVKCVVCGEAMRLDERQSAQGIWERARVWREDEAL